VCVVLCVCCVCVVLCYVCVCCIVLCVCCVVCVCCLCVSVVLCVCCVCVCCGVCVFCCVCVCCVCVLCVCVCMCVCMCVCVFCVCVFVCINVYINAHGNQKKRIKFSRIGSYRLCKPQMQVLGSKLGSSSRAANALNHLTTCPTTIISIWELVWDSVTYWTMSSLLLVVAHSNLGIGRRFLISSIIIISTP
jgi:hypothetical protein